MSRLPQPPTDCFGLPLAMTPNRARAISDALARVWRLQMGRPPGKLERDLEAVKTYFDPIASGARLRSALASMPPIDQDLAEGIPASVLLDAGEGRFLVTPEGRGALECLASALDERTEVAVIRQEWVIGVEHRLLTLYREWARQRLDKVLELQRGSGPPMLPQTIAAVLVLLVNGSIGPQKALVRPEDTERRRAVDAALAGPVEAFASAIAGGSRRPEHYSIYGGYALTEARRRLSDALSSSTDLYVVAGKEEGVVAFLGRDLARRHDVDKSVVRDAFDRLTSAYRQAVPLLASLGLAFESASHTRAVGKGLLAAFAAERE